MIGRTDLVHQVSRGAEHLDDHDLYLILAKVDGRAERRLAPATFRNQMAKRLHANLIADDGPALQRGETMQLA